MPLWKSTELISHNLNFTRFGVRAHAHTNCTQIVTKCYSSVCHNAIMMIALLLSVVYSAFAYQVTVRLIPKMKSMFLAANLGGIDLCKRNRDVKM